MLEAILLGLVSLSGEAPTPMVYDGEWGEVALCAALERTQAADRLPVVVRGVYVYDYMFDADDPDCAAQIEPVTCVEFSPELTRSEEVRALRDSLAPATVTFKGVLSGPHPVADRDSRGEERTTSPTSHADILNRLAYAANAHYCGNLYRTKFVVDEVLSVEPFDGAVPDLSKRPDAAPELPSPIAVGVLSYPPAALRIDYEGSVLVDVQVSGGRVHRSIPTYGDPALIPAVLAHLDSWVFSEDAEAEFTVEYEFKLERRRRGESRAPRIELLLPTYVGVAASEYDH